MSNIYIFEPEVMECLKLKNKSTRRVYLIAFQHFLKVYQKRGGKDFTDFLERIFA